MNIVPVSYYLVLSAILFGLGIVAFVFKRNIITLFMAIELMLNAVNLAFVAFARAHNQLDGLVFVFFVIVVAAAEAAVGLAIGLAGFLGQLRAPHDEPLYEEEDEAPKPSLKSLHPQRKPGRRRRGRTKAKAGAEP